jgi:uncharacterized membrane protein YedE/YeeE
MEHRNQRYINPYLAGVLLGLLLVVAYGVLGTGIGASGGLARIGAGAVNLLSSQHVAESTYFGAWGNAPMMYYLVFMLIGIALGGGGSALRAKRFSLGFETGYLRSTRARVIFVLAGGILVGFASRLARGCTSGQALSGGAQLLTGSFVFVAFLFVSGYVTARFIKEQWHD